MRSGDARRGSGEARPARGEAQAASRDAAAHVPRLEFSGVTRRFGRHEVLHGIDLRLHAGQRLVLSGPNGAGKTTLLRLAAGLLRPTHGTVRSGGHAPTDPAGRRRMAYLSQDAPVYAELTVREHLSWWMRMHDVPLDEGVVAGWLDRSGLRRLAQARASALSRGQRQRLAIAMCLAPKPDLLLLDEPTTALDAAGRQWLTAELAGTDAAMLIASHEPWPDPRAEHVMLDAGRVQASKVAPAEGRDTGHGAGRGAPATSARPSHGDHAARTRHVGDSLARSTGAPRSTAAPEGDPA